MMTLAPETVVVPIISCIFGFPLLALFVICCLRRRAKLARELDRRRHYESGGPCSIVRFTKNEYLGHSTRAIILHSSLTRGFPSLETVVEDERSQPDSTDIVIVSPDSEVA